MATSGFGLSVPGPCAATIGLWPNLGLGQDFDRLQPDVDGGIGDRIGQEVDDLVGRVAQKCQALRGADADLGVIVGKRGDKWRWSRLAGKAALGVLERSPHQACAAAPSAARRGPPSPRPCRCIPARRRRRARRPASDRFAGSTLARNPPAPPGAGHRATAGGLAASRGAASPAAKPRISSSSTSAFCRTANWSSSSWAIRWRIRSGWVSFST